MDVLLVLVLAAVVVVLCLGLLVLLGDPESPGLLDLRGRKDRRASPEVLEHPDSLEEEVNRLARQATTTKATATRRGKTTRTTRARGKRKDETND